jgi:TRAP-type C4-dicarboxylate transport system permease small subunit
MRVTGRVIVRVVTGIAYLGGAIWLVLMILAIFDIIRRNSGLSGFIVAAEFTEIVMVIPIFLGLAYAEYTGAHVRTGIVTTRLSHRSANLLRSISMTLVVALLIVMTAALAQHAIEATIAGEFRFGIGQVLIWPSRIVAAFGAFAMLVVCAFNLIDLIRATVSTDAAPYLPVADDEAGAHV